MPVARQKEQPRHLALLEPCVELRTLLRITGPDLLIRAVVDHLAAAHDDLEGGRAGCQAVEEPGELGLAKQRLGVVVGRLPVGPVVAVVEHEELGVAPDKAGEDTRGVGEAVARVGPEGGKGVERRLLEGVAPRGIVGAVVVVVPGGDVVGRGQQRLQLGRAAAVGVAIGEAVGRLPVHLAEVDVVAKPEHQVGLLARHAPEDLILAAVALARTVVLLLVDVGAGAEGHLELRRVGAPLPERLRDEAAAKGQLHAAAIYKGLIQVAGAGLEPHQPGHRGEGALRVHLDHLRANTVCGARLGPGLEPDLARPIQLQPDGRLAVGAVAHHRSRDTPAARRRLGPLHRARRTGGHGAQTQEAARPLEHLAAAQCGRFIVLAHGFSEGFESPRMVATAAGQGARRPAV